MRSRLKDMRIYLAGTMEYAPDGGTPWRRKVTPRLESMGMIVLDPTDRPAELSFTNSCSEDTALMRSLRAAGDYETLAKYAAEIVHQDLGLVDRSDVILVHLDATVPTVGTIDEFVTASNARKPILFTCEQGPSAIPIWVWGRLGSDWRRSVCANLDDALDRLHHIATCPDDELEKVANPKKWLWLTRQNKRRK